MATQSTGSRESLEPYMALRSVLQSLELSAEDWAEACAERSRHYQSAPLWVTALSVQHRRNAERLRTWQIRWRDAKGTWPASAWPGGAEDTSRTLRIPGLRRISKRATGFG